MRSWSIRLAGKLLLNRRKLVWALPGNTCGRPYTENWPVPLTYVRSCTRYYLGRSFGIDSWKNLKKIWKKKFFFENFSQNHLLLPYILDFENLSKSITRKILVVGIYGRSPLFRLIERKNLSPHWPSLVELYAWGSNFTKIALNSFGAPL